MKVPISDFSKRLALLFKTIELMTCGIRIVFLLLLPWLIHAKDEFEYHLWPSVQSVSDLIKRYEGALRFVRKNNRLDFPPASTGLLSMTMILSAKFNKYFSAHKIFWIKDENRCGILLFWSEQSRLDWHACYDSPMVFDSFLMLINPFSKLIHFLSKSIHRFE